MHRIDTINARPNANGSGKAGYHLNDDLTGVDPTNLDPEALNAIQEEICAVIEATGEELIKGTNDQLLTAIQHLIVEVTYPVNRTIEFATDVNPNILWPWTTWVRFAQGKTTVGYLNGDADFGVVGNTGGKKGHKMTAANLISHNHSIPTITAESSSFNAGGGSEHRTNDTATPQSNTTGGTGQADPDAIPTLPPYIVTAKWVRTA